MVIGSGLSGTVAALRAASQGKRVIVVRKAWGGTALGSGAFEIADSDTLSQEVPYHMARIKKENPDHPYHQLNAALLEPALHLFKEAFPFSLEGSLRKNHVLMLQTGQTLNAAFAMTSHFFDLQTNLDKNILVLGVRPIVMPINRKFKNLTFDHVDWPASEANLLPATIAKSLDHGDRLKQFAAQVKSKTSAHHFDILLMPPFLGLDRFVEVRKAFEMLLGTPVFEMLGVYPSVPGIRFQKGLEAALAKKKISIVQGRVEAIHITKRRVVSIEVKRADQIEKIEGAGYVLATGKFFSGGIRKEAVFRETVFNLPLFYQHDPVYEKETGLLVKKDFLKKQPLFQMGVRTDKDLKPVGQSGDVLYDNVRVCGTILAGIDPHRDHSRFGVSLLSGYQAGELAQ